MSIYDIVLNHSEQENTWGETKTPDMEMNVRGKEHIFDRYNLVMLPGSNPSTVIVLTP